uniref:Uncharacterized protein n=1 Tax=Pararge aegeria TaxID=116150 RepID=S4PVS9_9NEOP
MNRLHQPKSKDHTYILYNYALKNFTSMLRLSFPLVYFVLYYIYIHKILCCFTRPCITKHIECIVTLMIETMFRNMAEGVFV